MKKINFKLGISALMVLGVMVSQYIIQEQFDNIQSPVIRVDAAPEDMILEYTTTASNQTILLPFRGTTNVTIDWNNGLAPVTKTSGSDASFTYPTIGTYQIVISGSMTGYGFESFQFFNFQQSNQRLIKVIQWGSTGVTSLSGMFMGANNLTFVPSNIPTTVTNLSYLFNQKNNWTNALTNISTWDVSRVTNFSNAFAGAGSFNTDISGWNTSAATNMSFMFYTVTSSFNQDLTGWNVSNVTNFQSMFDRVRNGNPNVSTWNTSSATNMAAMFFAANKFNGNIGNWNVSNVTNMANLFYEASIFNQNLNNWNVSNVTNMEAMFRFATAFNQPLGNWDVSNVTNFGNLFASARAFNQDISGWDVSSAIQMYGMFNGASNFNQPLNSWDVSNATSMYNMFDSATAFNQPLNNWNVANVVTMSAMFNNTNFNQSLSSWNVSRVVNFSQMFRLSKFNLDISTWNTAAAVNMLGMFQYNTVFNQPLNTWNVNAVTNMSGMFDGATAFNQPLNNWNTANVVDMNTMFRDAVAFNQDITGWNTAKVTSMYAMFNGAKAFNYNISTWDVSKVTQFGQMFQNADAFNQPIGVWNTGASVSMAEMFAYNDVFDQYIGEWNTSKVTSMAGMFRNSIFNQDIGGWDTSLVIHTYSMFAYNEVFNQDISSWNVANVTLMFDMFRGAVLFNQPLNTWNTVKVTQTHQMFEGALAFNQPLDLWDMRRNETTFSMFKGAIVFNQDLPWTTSALVNASEMFYGATAFNGEVESFDMSKVLFPQGFFRNATSFNQPIPDWNFAVVNTSVGLERFFSGATSFNQDISGWNFTNIRNFRYFMEDVNLNPLYYDALLDTLIDQNVTIDLQWGERQLHMGNSKYSKIAKTYKDTLVSTRSWNIIDGGELTLTISVNDEEIYFGDAEPTYSVSYTGLVEGAGEDTLVNNYVFTRTPGTAVGDYTISVSGGDESYYYVSYVTGTLSILKPEIDVSEVTWNYTTPFTYTGTPFTVTLVGVPNLITVTYSGNSQTNAGDYTASVTLTYDSDNYQLVGTIEPLTWTIEKAEYDMSAVSWSYSGTFTYDQTEKEVTVSNLPTGVTVASYQDNTASEPGRYTASVTFNYDSNNYHEPTIPSLNWEIFAPTITITFDSNGGTSVDAISGIFGDAITTPNNPTRTGFIFNGWSTSIPETMPNIDTTFVATWRSIESNNFTDQNLDALLDLSEYVGQDISIELIVELLENSNLSEEDQATLDAFLRENVGSSVESIYFDIQLLLNTEDDSIEINETDAGFEIILPVPTEFQGKDLYVVQMINGVATIIEGTYDATTQTIRFNISALGTYTLAYESFNLLSALALGGGALFGTGLLGWLFFILFGKRRKEKKNVVKAIEEVEEDESMENVTIFQKPIKINQAFYDTLTPELQTEFRQYFVDDTPQHLMKELIYKLGEMNEAFFMDVYRYLYRFRKLISAPLLKAITEYGLGLAEKQPQSQTLIYEAATKTAYARRKDQTYLELAIQYARKDIALQRDVLNPRKKFVYSFYRLSIILEKQKQIKEALVLVNEGLARELIDKTKGGYAGRKARLLSKQA